MQGSSKRGAPEGSLAVSNHY